MCYTVAGIQQKGVFGMLTISRFMDCRDERSLVLTESQYHALLCVHSTNMGAPASHETLGQI